MLGEITIRSSDSWLNVVSDSLNLFAGMLKGC